MSSPFGLERDVVIVACAISAGIHAALVRDHFKEGTAAGTGFLAAAVLLTGLAVVLTYRTSLAAIGAAGVVLAGLLTGYALATTTGIPLLHPEPESIDGLALATKAIEALGLIAALHSIGRGRPAVACSVMQTKGGTAVSKTRTHRPVQLGLILLIATFSALVALAVSGGHSAEAHGAPGGQAGTHAVGATGSMSQREFALRTQMRKLWEDHITWTRMVIIDFAAGLPDLKAAEQRLLRNQVDIGNAIKPYYGAAAGNALTRLLQTHILEAVPVLTYAKAGDKAKLTQALNAWYANANQIARFLSKANPRSWPLAMTTKMMKDHLALTTEEAVARLQGKWGADIAAYDKVHTEILEMSDMLSSGLVAQFQSRFR